MDSRRGGSSSTSKSKGVSNTKGQSGRHVEYMDHTRKRSHRSDTREEAGLNENEPMRSHFKPNPGSHHDSTRMGKTPKPKTLEDGSGTSSAQLTEDDVPLANFFEFTTKNIPKLKPMISKEMDAPIKLKIPQRAHYNLHSDDGETSYVKSGSVKTVPIPSHTIDSDEEDIEPIAEVPKAQRDFKKELVLKYDFDIFKFPHLKDLAVNKHKRQIIDTVESHRVVVIEGFTGCGKTTQVPQFIMDDCVARGQPCNIVVAQPRRIAAVSMARRVCEERGWKIGSVVGYQIGMETKSNRQETMITYMTTGVLLQKLIHSKTLGVYSHIIIDEVHERDLETDFLLLVIKKILMDDLNKTERHVKVILMSATLNASKFSKYFVAATRDGQGSTEAPVIKIPVGKTNYPVEEIFIDDLSHLARTQGIYSKLMEMLENPKDINVLEEIYTLAVQIIVQLDDDEKVASIKKNDPRRASAAVKNINLESRGSVLVFLPGRQAIEYLHQMLNAESREYKDKNRGKRDHKWNIIQLHSTTTSEEQVNVFEPSLTGERKIILATNIAESSLTVADVVYVMDFCLTKSQHVDSRTNYGSLRMTWASIDQCTQRKGRTGRVAPGKVFRLVPRRFYSRLNKESPPEMKRSGIETVVLRVKKLGLGSPKDMLALAIDPPRQSAIERAVVNLKEAGALTILMTNAKGETRYDTCDGDLTFMGKVMSTLPISHQCARLIMLGHVFGVMDECIIIAAGLSVNKNPFRNKNPLESHLAKLNWASRSQSDSFAILYAFREWMQRFGQGDSGNSFSQSERVWATVNSIQTSVMREIKYVTQELRDRLKNHGIIPKDIGFVTPEDGIQVSKEQGVMIKVAIAGAFYPNYFIHTKGSNVEAYVEGCSREVNGNDPLTTVYYKGFPSEHNGVIYSKHIADRLAIGLDVPRVTFKGQFVFVTFDCKARKIGSMSRSVYRAIKIRQLWEKMKFYVLRKEDEPQYLEVHNPFQGQQRIMPCPPQIVLPGVGCSNIDVIVTYVENPSQFYIIYKQHEAPLKEMDEFINNTLSGEELSRDQMTPGSFCLAQYTESGRYYRARIRATSPLGEMLVYFVDCGNSEWVNTMNLKPFSRLHLEHQFHLVPALAVECRLGEIRPAVLFGSVWNHEAIKEFKSLVQVPVLRMTIFCVVKSVIVGTLFGENTNGTFDVNTELVKCLYADRVEENRVCKFNNRARTLFHLIRDDLSQIQGHNREQMEKMEDYVFVKPPNPNSHIGMESVELNGPWSPLELNFAPICNSSSMKGVTVDYQSVNSVTLDQEPTAPISRLLIASSVVIQGSVGRVSARDTTLMPAIPGLLGLLSMIFSSKIELRVDEYQSKYTGVLCGLGMDPQEAPVYQDHDVEVVFDAVISNDDIKAINKIRNCINLILREPSDALLGPTHKSVVEEMFRLLKKDRRRVVEEVWPQESHVWNRIDPALFQLNSEHALQPTDIFCPHSTVELQEGNARLNVSYVGEF